MKDPILGYIHISEDDRKLIDSFPVQRLRRIKQLSLADIVYPGATHTRFEHSLGVMQISTMMARNLPVELEDDEVYLVRISGLLHDVGHGPFSHLFEVHLEKHLGKDHEDMGVWVIRRSELADIISSLGYSVDEVVEVALGRGSSKPPYIKQIVRSAVDADKLDFIRRDNYHTGAGYGNIDVERLIYTLELVNEQLAVNMTSLSVLETYIIARMKSFESIYYHKTIRAAQLMFVQAIEYAIEEFGFLSFDDPQEYLTLDDFKLWNIVDESRRGGEILSAIKRRDLIKLAYERKYLLADELIVNLISNERIREEAIEEISKLSGVDPAHIYIDAPSLPSIPYHRAYEYDPMEVPIVKMDSGEREVYRLSRISPVVEVIRGYLNIFRVYTLKKHREKVREACKKLFGAETVSSRISA